MEALDYLFALVPALVISFALGALIRWLTADWQSNHFFSWQNVLGAALRALPWALAFSPVMMMKGGRGVLVPGSLCLVAVAYWRLFDGNTIDSEDMQDVHAAVTPILTPCAAITFLFFMWQCA